MINKVHVYQMRHVFVDDENVGKFNLADRTLRFRPEADEHKDRCLAHFRMVYGMHCKALVGDEELAAVAPLREFPEEVRALMDLRFGDRTPAVIAWARENFTATEFALRYPTLFEDDFDAVVGESPLLDAPVMVERAGHGVTADDLGGPIDHDDDDEEAAAIPFPAGTSSDPDGDDFADEDPLKGVAPDPSFNEGEVDETDVPDLSGFSLEGDDIVFNGKAVASLFGEERQLRMKQGQHGKKAGVTAFLASLPS